jgi:hypothetical protein
MRRVSTGVTFIGQTDPTPRVHTDSHSFPLRDAPPNAPERTEKIERIIERVIEEHSETLEKLADE